MRNPKFWLCLILFLVIFGAAFGAVGFALVVTLDYVFRFLLPYAVLAASAILVGAGLMVLAADMILSKSSSGGTRWFSRRARLHSLIYAVETGSGQRRRTRGAYNNV